MERKDLCAWTKLRVETENDLYSLDLQRTSDSMEREE